jgi:DNA modification methylase
METHTLWDNCLIILKDIPDNSIDAVITDPPYEINFMLRLGIKLEFPNIDLWHELLRILSVLNQVLIYWLLEEHVQLVREFFFV